MKVKNIMFSGFMAAILMSATGAADAAISVASKDYVDAKSGAVSQALETYKTANDTKVNKNAADIATNSGSIQSVANTLTTVSETLATKAGQNYVDTELAKKQNNLTVTGGVLTWDAATSTLGLTGIATSDNLDTLQNTVNTLSADANTDGSVKKQIADAIAAEVTRSDSYADQAEADAIAAAKSYADGLADNYDAAGSAAAAQAAAEATAAGALSSAKTELEGKIDAKVAQTAYNEKIQALEAADATFATTSAMNTELAKKQDKIDDLDAIRSGAALGATSFQAANVAEGEEEVAQENLDKFVPTLDRAQKMIDDSQTDLITDVTNLSTAVEAAQAQADKGVADAATAKSAADAAQDAADAAAEAAAQALTDAKTYADEAKAAAISTAATDATTKANAAQEAAEATAASALTEAKADIAEELATKITAPAACETQDCVLSINKASGTISWTPLTEPVADYLNQ